MLIVIVIIGILAAALIPRLTSARGRANDVARKADLSNVAAVLVAYQIDHGKFPSCPSGNGCTLAQISGDLTSAGMDRIPIDPNTTRKNSGIQWWNNASGQFLYIPITRRWISENGFVLMAATETAWWSNWIAWYGINGDINSTTDYVDIKLCTDIKSTETDSNDWNWNCTYKPANDKLRYIYVY